MYVGLVHYTFDTLRRIVFNNAQNISIDIPKPHLIKYAVMYPHNEIGTHLCYINRKWDDDIGTS